MASEGHVCNVAAKMGKGRGESLRPLFLFSLSCLTLAREDESKRSPPTCRTQWGIFLSLFCPDRKWLLLSDPSLELGFGSSILMLIQ